VAYLKLHGCITRVTNPDCPLILAPDQYANYRQGRELLFRHLEGIGCDRPIVFVGSSLNDLNLRHMLLQISKMVPSHPRYYIIAPDVDETKKQVWEKHHISAIQGTLSEFMTLIDSELTSPFRSVPRPPASDHPITERFAVANASLSHTAQQFLELDADYVRSVQCEHIAPLNFYRGFSGNWSPIEQNLDVRRGLTDTILSDYFLDQETGHLDRMELVVIKAEAGAGKSVLLRRIAWDAARDYKCLCIFIKPHGVISSAAIQELITLCKDRIYLFVDRLGQRVREISSLAQSLGNDGRFVTVVSSERVNEWNVSCGALDTLVSDTYVLHYLSEKEVDSLLEKLESNHVLGTLATATTEDRRKAFVERAGRQLLVALHEATLGLPFEEIIEDEYNNVSPREAQRIYLTVCTLNRLGVPVRAGLISRVHGISFDTFKEKFFGPLAHIVEARNDPVSRDHVYVARHTHIAEIVFDRAFKTQEDRFNEYVSILNHINIDYAPDRRAFSGLMRGKTILDLFPNHELASKLYDLANQAAESDYHLRQQEAIYEMNRPHGNLKEVLHLLTMAKELAPYDKSVQHSLAEYYLRAADHARSDLEKDSLRDDAIKICAKLRKWGPDNAYPFHTLVKLHIAKLRDLLKRPVESVADSEVEGVLKDAEIVLREGLQRFPGDSHLLSVEADLANVLVDSERALTSMEKAFAGNRRLSHIAARLARLYERASRRSDSLAVLRQALEANANDKQLHFAYAQLLLKKPEDATDGEITYHLKRSFSPGDTNHEARLLYGRQLYLSGDIEGSKSIFNELRNARIAPQFKDKIQHPLDQSLYGSVRRKEASYCFISRDGTADWIYAHIAKMSETVWRALTVGERVSFKLGFSCKGPSAFDIRLRTEPDTD
jgi:cold shock CspA family protein